MLAAHEENDMKKEIIEADLEEVFKRNIPWKQLENKTVLITGANGMLASYMLFMLLYLNEVKGFHIHIIALVRSKDKLEERLGGTDRYHDLEVYVSSLENEPFIEGNVDYIIHAASLASPQHYGVRPIDVLMPNVVGSYYLLELAARKKAASFLLFSTGDIYGVVEGKDKIGETDYGRMDTLDIHNCYGESKRMAETMCKAWFIQKKVPAKIARIWHTYAPTMDIENDPRVFASFVKDIVNKKNIVMKSEGGAKRSFCYIADAIAAYFLVLLCGQKGEAYNVCNAQEFYSIVELADILVKLYPEMGLQVEKVKREAGDSYVENTVANSIPPDSAKLEALGWKPQYDVRSGFKRVIDSMR